MIKFFVFIFCLLLDNLFLPALIGPRPFFIAPIFLIALGVYESNWKQSLPQLLLFSAIAGFFSGYEIWKFIMPIIATAMIFAWLNKFFDFSYRLKEDISFGSIIFSVLLLVVFVEIYSFLFILTNNLNNLPVIFGKWEMFFADSSIGIILLSLGTTILFKIFLNPKS